MDINEFNKLVNKGEANGLIHYDISPVKGTTIKDLNLEIIRDYFLKYNTFDLFEESPESVERILINADILKEDSRTVVCSVGGLLVFGKNSDKYLSQSGVSFAHFKGKEITDELIDKKVVSGRIQDIAEQLLVIIKNNIIVPSKIKDLKREGSRKYM